MHNRTLIIIGISLAIVIGLILVIGNYSGLIQTRLVPGNAPVEEGEIEFVEGGEEAL